MIHKNAVIKVLLLSLLCAPFLLAYHYGLGSYMNIATLNVHRESLHQYVVDHYVYSVLQFIGSYIVVAAFSFPAVSLLTLLGGFLFGTLRGACYTNIGATIGATIAFLSYRYLFGAWVREHYGHRLLVFNNEIAHYGAWYLVVIRLIAIIPFFVANALASMAPISIQTFIWTTSLGIIPTSLIYSFAGKQLETMTSMRDVFSIQVIIAFGFLTLLALIPIGIRYIRMRKSHPYQGK